jgi:hypothetical protein
VSITTATELKTAIANWTKRDDLTDRLDEFIALAEAWFNRALRVRAMEEPFAPTALSSGAASLPSDFLAFVELRYSGDTVYTLQPRSIEWIKAQGTADTGNPAYFAVSQSSVYCWPTAGTVVGTYWKKIPSLTSDDDNWLLAAYPDLYLSACLTEASLYAMDPESAAMWRDRSRALLDEIQRSDDRNTFEGGPIAVRAR